MIRKRGKQTLNNEVDINGNNESMGADRAAEDGNTGFADARRKEGEVLVRIKSMGICGSDLHFYTDGKIGDYAMNGKPLILGHECAGEVVKAGEGCSRLSVGDRVIVEPGKPCMRCDECRAGRYNFAIICIYGYAAWDGCMCEYVAARIFGI